MSCAIRAVRREDRLSTAENRLIGMLPRKDRQRLLAACESFELVTADVLCESGAAAQHLYFPTRGFISLVTLIVGSPGLEVGMVGSDGVLGAQLVLGVATEPFRALVQGAGAAWRIETSAVQRELELSPSLRSAMLRFVYMRMSQLATSTACMRFHQVGPRLARWLLMSQDYAQSDTFRVTHEFLAYMLGVRRVSITTAASALQQRGLIAYRRGDLTVLNRKELKRAACGCYEADRLTYAALLRPVRT